MPIEIIIAQPTDNDIQPLIEALSLELEQRFSSSGKNSFQDWQQNNKLYIFAKAVNNNETVGCAAIRPISTEIAELKRMYSKYNRQGIGKKLLSFLEEKAKTIGYKEVWLETRKLNQEACSFYLKNGYNVIPNYGNYIGNEKAICFGKKL